MIDIRKIYEMISSANGDDIELGVGLVNNNIQEFSDKELEYIGYIIPGDYYKLVDIKIMDAWAFGRAKYPTLTQYEGSLPKEINEIREKVIDNIGKEVYGKR